MRHFPRYIPKVHPALLLLLFLSCLSPAFGTFRHTLFFAALHEGFHVVAALCLHVPILRLQFLPYGCRLQLAQTDTINSAIIAAMGPAGRLLLFFLLRHTPHGAVNLFLFLFNMLPALPLDGGRLCQLFLLSKTGAYYTRRILRALRLGIGGLLLLLAFLFSSFLCGWIGFFLLAQPAAPPPLYSAHKKTAHIKKIHIFRVRRENTLLDLYRFFSPLYHAFFFLKADGILLSEESILTAMETLGATALVSGIPQVYSQGSGQHTAAPAD